MGKLERKISKIALATALAKNPQPHRHTSGQRAPIPTYPPLEEKLSKWPSPAYAAKLRRKKGRHAVPIR